MENGDEVFDGRRFDVKTITFSDTAVRNVKLARAPTTTITVRSLKRKEVRFEIVGEGKKTLLLGCCHRSQVLNLFGNCSLISAELDSASSGGSIRA